MIHNLKQRLLRTVKANAVGVRLLHYFLVLTCYARRFFSSGFRKFTLFPRHQGPCQFYRLNEGKLPTYFGYYDKSPFSYDNQKILATAMSGGKDSLPRTARLPLKLGYFEWSEIAAGHPVFRQFGETTLWSWQQSCMLQWFPGNGNKWGIYNKLVDNRYGAVIQDVLSKEILQSYTKPIYAVDSVGRRGVSLNFSRLERLRPGYGYHNLPDETTGELCPETDGIWLLDLEQATYELLVSLEQIAAWEPVSSMAEAEHYVNHLLFSPNGKHLIFLHLWQPRTSNYQRRQNRLMLYSFDDKTLQILDTAINSHFSWLSNNELVSFRYPIQGAPGYYIYQLDHATWQGINAESIELSKDGHPSLAPRGDLLVTDTYPDKIGDQHLYLYSFTRNKSVEIGRFFSPFSFRGFLRCDLHPRWDRSGSRLCIDSVHQGRRAMYVLDLGFEQIFDCENG